MKKLNLAGQRFGRLLVHGPASAVSSRTAWLCACDCGVYKDIKTDKLRSGNTKSCGCLNNEKRKKRAKKMYSHNIKYSPLEATARKVWRSSYNDGLSFEEFYIASQNNCYYCNAPPSNAANAAISDKKSSKYAKDNGKFVYSGLDRIDSSQNHNINNIVPCCKYCNYAKRERTLKEFKKWALSLYDNLLGPLANQVRSKI